MPDVSDAYAPCQTKYYFKIIYLQLELEVGPEIQQQAAAGCCFSRTRSADLIAQGAARVTDLGNLNQAISIGQQQSGNLKFVFPFPQSRQHFNRISHLGPGPGLCSVNDLGRIDSHKRIGRFFLTDG